MVRKKNAKKSKVAKVDKINSLKKDLDLLNDTLEISKEKNIRLLAEFDNYKRRTNQRISEKEKYEGISLIREIINIVDDVDRILSVDSVIEKKSVYDGVLLIKNKFISTLKDYGVESYESVDQDFNTDLHEAIMMKKTKKKTNTILEEYQKGYMYHDKVVRHSKVIVSE